MSVVLDLPPELEGELAAEADSLQLPLPDHIRNILLAVRAPAASPLTGTQLVAYWRARGLIGSRDDIVDSAEHARRLRAEAERRRD